MSTKTKASSKNKKATAKKVTKKVVAKKPVAKKPVAKKAVKVVAKAKSVKKSIVKPKVVVKKKTIAKPIKKAVTKKVVAKKVVKPAKKVAAKKVSKPVKKAIVKKAVAKKVVLKPTSKKVTVKVEKPIIIKEPKVKVEKPIKEKKVKTPIIKKPIVAPTTFRKTEVAPAKFIKEPAGKFEMEFVIRASEDMVFEFVSTESGLSEWFCDDVNIRDGVFTFNWDGQIQQAKLIKELPPISIRYQWLDKNDGSYFEFRTQKDELTNDISLIITDFASDKADEISARLLWHSQVDKLLHVLGSFF